MIVAVDGPAGSGKSTVCRLLAKALGYTYLDPGAMYRAVAWALLREGSRPDDSSELTRRLRALPLRFSVQDGSLVIRHGEQRLDDELRGPEISQESSRVSRLESVREFLVQRQRELGAGGGIVAEGRDMTTVVFPDAEVKVFLTADVKTRTERRLVEYVQKNIPMDYATLEAEIRERDERDQGRALAPLRPAPDALHLDTSGLSIPEVVERILELAREKKDEKPS